MIKLILRSALLAAFTISLGACNTVKGVGKDIKKAGETIEDAADKND